MKNKILESDLETINKTNLINWEEFSNKTFLISGSTGLLGSLLVKTLLYISQARKLNIRIIAIIRNEDKAERIFCDFSKEKENVYYSLEFIKVDITKTMNIECNVDYIIHCASPTSSRYFITYPVETIEQTVLGTKNLLDVAVKTNCKKFIYISSMEMYGQPSIDNDLIYEDNYGYINHLSIRSCYSEGKRICECLSVSASAEYGLDVSIARLAQTFGAGTPVTDSRVFSQFAKKVINKENIVLHTNGLSEGNYVYSSDAVIAILLLVQKGGNQEAYNVVNESSHMTIKNMAELVATTISNNEIKVEYDVNHEDLGYAPNVKLKLSSKKLRELGWKPEIGMVEAYNRLIASFKSDMEEQI